MSWSIRSRSDSTRWLESPQGVEFTADPQTQAALGDLAWHRFPKYPGGPMTVGVATPADLLRAVWALIPDLERSGHYPELETWPTNGGLLVY